MLKAGHIASPPGMVAAVQFLAWPLPFPFDALAVLACKAFAGSARRCIDAKLRSINYARFFSLACFAGGVHPSWESIAFM